MASKCPENYTYENSQIHSSSTGVAALEHRLLPNVHCHQEDESVGKPGFFSCFRYSSLFKNGERYLPGLFNREEVKIKRYFNIFRPLLAAKWIEKQGEFPPIKFTQLLEDILPTGEIRNNLDDIIKRKMAGEVLDLTPRFF
jgi:predicted nucleotidyltransferase